MSDEAQAAVDADAAVASAQVLVNSGGDVADPEAPSLEEQRAASGTVFVAHDLPEGFNPDDPGQQDHLDAQASFFADPSTTDSHVAGH